MQSPDNCLKKPNKPMLMDENILETHEQRHRYGAPTCHLGLVAFVWYMCSELVCVDLFGAILHP